MPVDREQWAARLAELPSWPCPTCNKGHYTLMADMPVLEETGPSKLAYSHDAWDADWIVNRFVALMKCNMSACGEIASVSGTSPTDYYEDHETGEVEIVHRYQPKSIDPCPIPIGLPKTTPEQVKVAIAEAAALIWLSSEAGANKIRSAVEHLLDAKKIRKTSTKNGKKSVLTLHSRIIQFQKNDAENGDILLAVKWLGNSGSHISKLSRDDVLDAFDMIELVLENLYGNTKQMIMQKVAAINKNKGPVKPAPEW